MPHSATAQSPQLDGRPTLARVGEDRAGSADGRLNPTALPVADVARLLTRVGGEKITEEMVKEDVEAGAPTNADGTINVVHYTAWLAREEIGQ